MSSELQALRPGDTFATRYRVVRMIRAGGMGAVYEVEDTATKRRRALKLMHPSLVQSADSRMRFQREVFIGAELETEHVVEVVDAGLDQATQTPFMTMELLKGEELGDRLERQIRLPPEEVVAIFEQLARALDKAHGKGIVHRDLKPENIYLTTREDGTVRVKILDFGIAKLVEGAQTSATQAAGTPLYMAPEQTDKASHVSAQTDIWAIGLVAYRMIVGVSYWQGESLQQLYRQILMDPITSPVQRAYSAGVQLPATFDYWFSRCVNRNPQERFTSASQAVAELANVFGMPQSAYRGSMIAPPPTYVDQTAPPVASMTPQTVPTPATLSIPGGTTPYPAPQVTPYPSPHITPSNSAPAGTLLSPGPMQSPFAAGTQVAPDGMYGAQTPSHISSAGPQVTPAQHFPPPKKGGSGVLVGAIVAAVAIGGVGIYFGTRTSPDETAKGDADKSKADDKGDKKDDKSKDKKKVDDGASAEPNAWIEATEMSNEFLPVNGFTLQKHEVTREEYRLFLESDHAKKKDRLPLDGAATLVANSKEGKLPITWVTYEMAESYCKAIKGRLPTAAEWDMAVAGPSKSKYPWGNSWVKGADVRDVAVERGTSATLSDVGTSSKDKAAYGHVDLAGNAQEWTSTDDKDGKSKLVRGSSASGEQRDFDNPGSTVTATNAPAGAVREVKSNAFLGFRCARDK